MGKGENGKAESEILPRRRKEREVMKLYSHVDQAVPDKEEEAYRTALGPRLIYTFLHSGILAFFASLR